MRKLTAVAPGTAKRKLGKRMRLQRLMLAVTAEGLTSASLVGGQAARAAEAEAVRERIASALGTRVSERKLGDLMRLAHFQMLGREARAWRSPTAILARRPLRRACSALHLWLAGCRDPQMCAGDPASLAVSVSWRSDERELSGRGGRGGVCIWAQMCSAIARPGVRAPGHDRGCAAP